ncbi:sulfatase [Sedimentisphaera salicampi]|uniref:sulfatase n=1 Tax=Sedimentisphaera salicampi TaxID=1941349 RepID=UPI000B9B8B82|nr:sulfatase [Sedimentisphaera salicampi]OXU14390.1 Choline-sulfatase [Sedimentisphaera salicampi]
MKRRTFLKSAASFSAAAGFGSLLPSGASAGEKQRPNVLLIVCDDLNDYVQGMGGHPQAKTPNIEKLAKSGTLFKRAYSNNPVCAPSRASFLTGIYPQSSKNLFFNKWFKNPVLKNSKSLMKYFSENGYKTAGSGKLMHHCRPNEWNQHKYHPDYGPFVFDGENRIAHPSVPEPYSDIGAVDGSYAPLSDVPFPKDKSGEKGWIYGYPWGENKKMEYEDSEHRDPTPDERNADWAAGKIREFEKSKDSRPFMLGVGFVRPHTPFHVPKKYFDMFPVEDVKVPMIKLGDKEDTHYLDVYDDDQKGPRYFKTLGESYSSIEEGLRHFTQGYLASVAAVDDCISKVLNALEASSLRDNTIVVMTSDHGWNMGEKDYLFKNSLWEESTRVPLIVRAPGLTKPGTRAEHPVSLIDIYPTLKDLCGLKGDTRKNSKGAKLDGFSMKPFLENPKSMHWDGPEAAISMIYAGGETGSDPMKQNWSVRTVNYRYIVYRNGAEELYDHRNDPYEWHNLAELSSSEPILNSLGRKLASMLGGVPEGLKKASRG